MPSNVDERDRLGRVLLLAPLAGPIAVACCLLLYGTLAQSVRVSAVAGAVAAYAAGVSYILTIVVGLPAHWFLQRQGLNRLWHYGLAGLLLGTMSFLVPIEFRRWQLGIWSGASLRGMALAAAIFPPPIPWWWLIGLGSISGVAVAATGWCLLATSGRHSAV